MQIPVLSWDLLTFWPKLPCNSNFFATFAVDYSNWQYYEIRAKAPLSIALKGYCTLVGRGPGIRSL